MSIPNNFDYEYRVSRRFGSWNHMWLIHGPRGSLHFHCNDDAEHIAKYGPSAGLECHYRTPPRFMSDRAPSHLSCSVLEGAPCWHDGTSLYAVEHLYPMVDWKNPLELFVHLVGEMRRFDDEE